MTITVTDLGKDGARVSFPYDKVVSDAFRTRFSKARWTQSDKSWLVPGPTAFERVTAWKEEIEAKLEAEKKQADERRHEAQAALEARKGDIKSKNVTVSGNRVRYGFAYSDRSVAIARASGGKFDSVDKVWIWQVETVEAVDTLIEALNRIFEINLANQKRREEEKKAREAEWARERAKKDERMSEVRSHRFVVLASRAPAPGQTMRLAGRAVTIESLGKQFRADDSLSSMGGPIGVEGEWVRYAYHREATAEEIAALEAREAEFQEAAARKKARSDAIRVISDSRDRPDLGKEPEGEVIWSDDRNRPTGHAVKVILTEDGWLWYVVYDGSDGAAWGMYNCGYNTTGSRVVATPELVAAIRESP